LADQEDRDWQRLDKWLWCARFMRQRSDCAALVAEGSIRINRQPTVKPHARLRIGDVLTIPVRGQVRVIRVAALAVRRGPAPEAALLYAEVTDAAATGCTGPQSSAYPGA
jgi:ribosome-associated heat shock protein Hsp15